MRQKTPLLLFITFVASACFTYYAAADCMRYRDVCFAPGPAMQMAPYRYRLLEPLIMSPFASSQDYMIMGAILWQVLFNAITFPLLYSWLSRHLSAERTLVGLMIYVLVNVAAYHLWFINLAVPIEAACLALVLALIERSWWVLLPIVFVASFNRETAVYLAAIYTAWHWNDDKRRGGFMLIGVWTVITAGLHIILGPAAHVNGSLLGMLQYNISNLPDAFFANLILSPLYWLVWKGYRGAELRYKRLALLGAAYLLAACVGGNWGESQRYMLLALPVFLPIMLNSQASRI